MIPGPDDTPNPNPDPNPNPNPSGGTPAGDEWKAPESKDAFDKLINDAVTAEAAKYKAPDKYDLKLSDDTKLDPKLTERTAATARTLGLSNENAQKALEFIAQEVATHSDQRVATALADYSAPSKENPQGGAKWREQEQQWRDAALKDAELGAGKPEALKANTDLGEKVLAKFGDEKLLDFLHSTGLGSNPDVMKFLVRIGKSMKESELIPDSKRQGTDEGDPVGKFYGPGRGADPRGATAQEPVISK